MMISQHAPRLLHAKILISVIHGCESHLFLRNFWYQRLTFVITVIKVLLESYFVLLIFDQLRRLQLQLT